MVTPENDNCNDGQCIFIRSGISHKISEHDQLKKQKFGGLTPEKVFRPTVTDLVHTGIKAGFSSIPLVGGPISEILSFAVNSPINKRIEAFITSLDLRVKDIEAKGQVNYSEFIKDDEFIDVLIQSLQLVAKNSQDEKIEMIRNCVLNTALHIDIERDKKMMFLNTVNQITPHHLKVLEVITQPSDAIKQLLEMTVKSGETDPQITLVDDFYKYLDLSLEDFTMLVNDLDTMGILTEVRFPQEGMVHSKRGNNIDDLVTYCTTRLTPYGRDFIRFINPPNV